MVTDSHHWLNTVRLFPSNFSRFSIFRCDVCIRSARGSAYCWVRAAPSAISWTSSWGVNVGRWFLVSDGRGDRVSGSGRDGGPNGGLDSGLPVPPPCGFLHSGGVAWVAGIMGMAGRHTFFVCGGRGSWMGLLSAERLGSGGGALGTAGVVVLEGLSGLHQS